MTVHHLSKTVFGSIALLAGITVATPAEAVTLTGFSTFGSNMAGMEVTVNYLNGGSQTAIWQTTGLESGGAFGSGWSLVLSGDTFNAPWTLSTEASFTQAIASLIINAIPGNTVFDIVQGEWKTPGSANGFPFTVFSGQAPTTFAYTTDILGAEDDLKGTLSLNWSNGFIGQMQFQADTDSGIETEPVAAVPEPATIGGILLATAGLTRLRQRRRAIVHASDFRLTTESKTN